VGSDDEPSVASDDETSVTVTFFAFQGVTGVADFLSVYSISAAKLLFEV
jgi:hypothetical protein